MTQIRCHTINLTAAFGGGEAYTHAYVRALVTHHVPVTLYVRPGVAHWKKLQDVGGEQLSTIEIDHPEDVLQKIQDKRAWIVTHHALPDTLLETLSQTHFLTGFAHLPAFKRDLHAVFKHHHLVFAVSNYVRTGLISQGISQVYESPMLGSSALQERDAGDTPIVGTSPYDWDRRKFRDRMLSLVEPVQRSLRSTPIYARRPGITLGVVSLLSPIKQFPELFQIIAPIIAEVPGVNLEIFGSGGYAMVRDIKKALHPIADRVRYWGMQRNVGAVYRQVDWLLSGLPDKEALGLNLIEAQSCGTPVIAVKAPPFTETVGQGSGYLYADPRTDGGTGFRHVLLCLQRERRPDPRHDAATHLAQFSFPAFAERVRQSANSVAGIMSST